MSIPDDVRVMKMMDINEHENQITLSLTFPTGTDNAMRAAKLLRFLYAELEWFFTIEDQS